MNNKLEEANRRTISELHKKLEDHLNSDVFTYYGEIINGVERQVKDIIQTVEKPLFCVKQDRGSKHILDK